MYSVGFNLPSITLSAIGMQVNINTTVTLFITCDSSSSERRFDKLMSIGDLKERLCPITGVPLSTMQLALYSKADQLVCYLKDEATILGSYFVDDYMRIDVIDSNPNRRKGEFTDVSLVEKFEISADDYNKRSDSVRAFKERNRIGRFADKNEAEETRIAEEFIEEAKLISVGARCLVEPVEGGMGKRGLVMYVGTVEFKGGYWVGVHYDEPIGKHNGTVQGKQYFSCLNKHGAFVRPNKLQTGDFPEEDLFDDEEM